MDTAAIVDRIVARRGQVANAAAEEAYILQAVNEIYRDILAYHDWPWLMDQIMIRIYPLKSFTATVTVNSAIVGIFAPVLVAADEVYEGGFLADANGEMHEILQVNFAGNTITLREPWVGPTTALSAIDIFLDRYPVGAITTAVWNGTGTVTIATPTLSALAPIMTAAVKATYDGGWVIGSTGEMHRIVNITVAGNTVTMDDNWIGPTTALTPLEFIPGTPEVEHILSVSSTGETSGGYQLFELADSEIDSYVSDRRYPPVQNLIYWARGGIDPMGRPTVRFWPIPHDDLYVYVHIKKRPPDLTNNVTSIPQMPSRWHHVIVAGTLAMLSGDDGLNEQATNRQLILYTTSKDAMIQELAKTHGVKSRTYKRWDEAPMSSLDRREWWRYVEQ